MILADTADARSCPAEPTPVRFDRAASVEAADAVQAFGGRRSLQAATTTVLAWDHEAKRAVATSVETAAAFGGPNGSRPTTRPVRTPIRAARRPTAPAC